MKPKNFPGRKQARRERAIDLHHKSLDGAKTKIIYVRIVTMIENTHAKLVEDVRAIRSKMNREVKKYG